MYMANIYKGHRTDWLDPISRAKYMSWADTKQPEIERAHSSIVFWSMVNELDNSNRGWSYIRSYFADKAMALDRSLPDRL